jgi:hypothetical protein
MGNGWEADGVKAPTSSATTAPKVMASADDISPTAMRAAMARTKAATPKSWPIRMSRASEP